LELISLKLRGAIGIERGMGLDEIEIDFTKFDQGLITIAGLNGAGKTTIMDNLHPYLQLVSRGGKLQDHFFLKDSCRDLTFRYKDKTYRSLILIDAQTEKIEAYLYEGDRQLTNGQVKTYKEEIEKVIGDPRLFFNSLFSGQLSAGFSKMKASERRDLIYNFLNLKMYEVWTERAKEKRDELSDRLTAITAEIELLTKQAGELNVDEDKIRTVKEGKIKFELKLKELEGGLSKGGAAVTETRVELSKLQEKKKEQAEIEKKIKELGEQADKVEQEKIAAKAKVDELLREELNAFRKSNKYLDMQKDADKKYEETAERISGEIDELTEKTKAEEGEISEAGRKQTEAEKKLARNEKILENKETIKLNLDNIDKLSLEINELRAKENAEMAEAGKLQEKSSAFVRDLSGKESAANSLYKELQDSRNELSKLEQDKKFAETNYNDTVKRCDKAIANIGTVPCSTEIGKGCRFLTDAYEAEDEKKKATEDYERKSAELKPKINKLTIDVGVLYSDWKIKDDEVNRLKKENPYEADIKRLTASIEAIRKEIKQKAGELSAITEKGNWKQLQEEAGRAESEIALLRETISNLKAEIERKKKNIIEYSEKINRLKGEETKAREEAGAQKKRLEKMALEEEAQIEEKHTDKRLQINDDFNKKKRELLDRAEEEDKKLNRHLEAEIRGLELTLDELNGTVKNIEMAIETQRGVIETLRTELQDLEGKLIRKRQAEDEAESKRAEAKLLERDIKDYLYLIAAFGPKGIPVLKLENMIYELTQVVNEYLKMYESRFRVKFALTALSADGKKTLDTFDIIVIDDESEGDIENKSGGEKVIIEGAIQLALMNIVLMNGKRIDTVCLDEKDGSLDEYNALNYIKMVKKAHKDSGVHHTFLITQRNEIKDLIPQKIILEKGKGVTIETQAA
jgi:DNA repair exonuclease SbcCD ATPase subunit